MALAKKVVSTHLLVARVLRDSKDFFRFVLKSCQNSRGAVDWNRSDLLAISCTLG